MPHLARHPIDIARLLVEAGRPDHGALATFIGTVRDHHGGRGVLRLEYSAYEAMAESVCAEIVAEAEARWPVALRLVHRLGALSIGDAAVAVVAGSAHRAAAFDACRYAIEEVKRRAPIWKREFYADGTVGWVDPTVFADAAR